MLLIGLLKVYVGSKYVCAYLDIEKLLITKVYTGILSGSMSIEEFQTGVQ